MRAIFPGPVLLGAMAMVMCTSTLAQPAKTPDGIAVSAETCAAAFLTQWRGYFRTAASDGRPGFKYYVLGVDRLCRHDYVGAMHLFRVAGSWGYKPAEYSVAAMYLRGSGVSVDIPLGAAWLELAAATGIPSYVKLRDLVNKMLTTEQLAQMQQLRGQLEHSYGAVALRRAGWQWTLAKNAITGSHLGHPVAGVVTAMGVPLDSEFRVLQDYSDPYPALDRYLTGSVTIGSLETVRTDRKAEQVKPGAHAQPQTDQQDHD